MPPVRAGVGDGEPEEQMRLLHGLPCVPRVADAEVRCLRDADEAHLREPGSVQAAVVVRCLREIISRVVDLWHRFMITYQICRARNRD